MEGSRLADNKYFRYYFYFVLGEIFLMGSGENLPIVGYFTVRIFNYMVGLLVSFYLFLRGDDFPKVILGFMLGFIVTTIVSYMMAVIQDSDPEYLMADMKQLCYFLILLYFYYAVSSELMMKRLVDILLICVGTMALLYLLYMTITDVLGLISMKGYYYHVLDDSGSFMFRGIGSSLFYKGFVYLPIGALGFFWRRQWGWFAVCVLAVYFTYTRGLYLLLAFGLLVFYLRTREISVVKLVGLVLVILLLYELAEVFGIFSFDQTFLANREESDTVRMVTFEQVMDRITWWSLWIGHGFGQGVPERAYHMEVSYMDIFHHQGIMGLVFWFAVLAAILRYGLSVPQQHREESTFFMTAAMMIYLQSCFNPYLNNSIGMSMVLLSFAVVYRLSQDEHFTSRSPL